MDKSQINNEKIIYLGRFNNSEILTGPEKFSRRLYENVLTSNNNTIFVEYYFKNNKESSLLRRFIGSKKVLIKPEVFRLGHLSLFLYLLKEKPDIIHILSSERYTICVLLYKFVLGSKVITTFHSVLRFEIPRNSQKKSKVNRYRDYLWEWLAIKLSDKLIFLTNEHIALAENYYRIDKGKVDIIPPGVEMEFLNKNKTLKINNLLKVVFYNGNNDFIDRGLDEMLEALKNPDFPMRLYIIGNKINIKDVGIDVEFVSPMKKYGLKNFLADKHILIKSSSFDSFSIFSIECMATGLIVVLSNKVGSAIYIKNGENGFVYDYSEPESVKDIFKDIYFHKYNLEAISKKAQEIVNELGWEIISKRYMDCYNEFL